LQGKGLVEKVMHLQSIVYFFRIDDGIRQMLDAVVQSEIVGCFREEALRETESGKDVFESLEILSNLVKGIGIANRKRGRFLRVAVDLSGIEVQEIFVAHKILQRYSQEILARVSVECPLVEKLQFLHKLSGGVGLRRFPEFVDDFMPWYDAAFVDGIPQGLSLERVEELMLLIPPSIKQFKELESKKRTLDGVKDPLDI